MTGVHHHAQPKSPILIEVKAQALPAACSTLHDCPSPTGLPALCPGRPHTPLTAPAPSQACAAPGPLLGCALCAKNMAPPGSWFFLILLQNVTSSAKAPAPLATAAPRALSVLDPAWSYSPAVAHVGLSFMSLFTVSTSPRGLCILSMERPCLLSSLLRSHRPELCPIQGRAKLMWTKQAYPCHDMMRCSLQHSLLPAPAHCVCYFLHRANSHTPIKAPSPNPHLCSLPPSEADPSFLLFLLPRRPSALAPVPCRTLRVSPCIVLGPGRTQTYRFCFSKCKTFLWSSWFWAVQADILRGQ